jgi:hypothetical protein
MMAREGFTLLLGVTGLAAATFAAALRFRSWAIWLAAFGVTIAALWVAWIIRPGSGAAA